MCRGAKSSTRYHARRTRRARVSDRFRHVARVAEYLLVVVAVARHEPGRSLPLTTLRSDVSTSQTLAPLLPAPIPASCTRRGIGIQHSGLSGARCWVVSLPRKSFLLSPSTRAGLAGRCGGGGGRDEPAPRRALRSSLCNPTRLRHPNPDKVIQRSGKQIPTHQAFDQHFSGGTRLRKQLETVKSR